MSRSQGYVIVTDSRKSDEVLFMVDRKKQRRSFWSNQTDDALVFASREAAERKAASLKWNNPRAIPLTTAQRWCHDQRLEALHNSAMDDDEAGWDGHKIHTVGF